MANYSLKILVDADDRASGKLHGLHNVLGTMKTGVQGLGNVALSGLGKLGDVVLAAGDALTKFTIDAAGLEDVRTAFTGIAESAGVSADEMLAALQRSTGGMVAQRDLMLTFNKAAQLVGHDFAVQLPDAMGYLSKVATATGQDVDFMLNSLVVGVGRLSPMILDNLGIQVSLAEATERAAQMFGVQENQLTKSQQQAGMMAVVLEKLHASTAAIPDTAESAAAKMAAFRVRLEDAAMEVGTLFVPTLGKLLDAAQPLISTALPLLIGLLERFAPTVEAIAGALATFTTTLVETGDPLEAIRTALAGFPELQGAFDSIVAGVRSFWDTVRPVVQPVLDWIAANVQLKDALIALGIAIAAVVLPALAPIVAKAMLIIGVFALLTGAVAAIRTAWENDFLGIRTLVETTLTNIQAWWTAHGDEIIAKAKQIWEGVKAAFQAFVEAFRPLYEAFAAASQGDWRTYGEKLRQFWDESWERLKNIVKAAFDWFKSVDWGGVGSAIIEGIANGIRAAVGGLANAARAAAQAALDAAKGFLGIHSPSQLFEEQIGRQMMAGWMRGIERMVPRLEVAAQTAAHRTVQSITNNYYLTVTSQRSAENVAQDFWMMRL